MEDYVKIKVPQQKLRVVGNTYIMTVPRKIVEKYGLKEKAKYSYVIHIRRNHMKKQEDSQNWNIDI